MKSVLVRLKEVSDNSSQVEKSVIGFILENPEQVSTMSIHSLAEKTFVSASSIVRMVNKLDFNGYKEFCHALINVIDILFTAFANMVLYLFRQPNSPLGYDRIEFAQSGSIGEGQVLIRIYPKK